MANSKVSNATKATVMAFFILLTAVHFQAHAFVFLVPIIASKSGSDSDKVMKGSDTLKVLVENTAVAELTEGTAYAFFKADGGAVGIHPVHGRLEGNWNVDSGGETCITWIYPSGSITNCANVAELGNGNYQWGDRKFSLSKGDVKNLN